MRLKYGISGAWLAVLAAVLDRITKAAMLHAPLGESIPLVPGVVSLRRVTNTGMAFSLLSESGALLTLLPLLLCIGLTAWLVLFPQRTSKLARAGLWLVVGGGLGNVYDRIVYGHVIDFIQLDFVRFAIFNAADMVICIGVALTAIAILRDERKKEQAHE